MFNYETGLNKFNRAYLDNVLADLPDDQLDVQPHPELHSARWILCHLAIAADYAFKMLDMPTLCSKAWHKNYGPSSQPGTAADVKPSRTELLAAIDDGYTKLCHALPTVSVEHLSVPHGVPLLEGTLLKTRGDLVCHILTTHFAFHVGQLSVNRRMMGRAPLV
jgi:uncharacterized damage-inducible protein DinB